MTTDDRQSAVVQLNVGLKYRHKGRATFICGGAVRGGTSAVAGLMQRLGVFMGEDLGNNYEDPAFLGKPIVEMREVIQRRNAVHNVWGWKNPHVANYLDHLMPDLKNPRLVIVYRDMVATMRAHMRWHNRTSAQSAHELLLTFQRNWYLVDRLKLPTLLVSYEKLLLAPELFVEELADFIGVARPRGAALTELAEFLAPGSYK